MTKLKQDEVIQVELEDKKEPPSEATTPASSAFRLIYLSASVFITFVIYGLCTEAIFVVQSRPWFITCLQFGFYTLISGIEVGTNQRKVPMKTYRFLALVTVGTMGLSNGSLIYLNFPTQVVFKSCKLIPVMIGGILIQKKTYKLLDYVAVVTMCLGLVIFLLADVKVSQVCHKVV